MQFDKDKTELIHFFTKDMDEIHFSADFIVKPKSTVKWLGVWLDTHFRFKDHVEKRIASAERTLSSIIRLSNTERGLSFQAMRQLYISVITAIADYEVQIWWNNQRYLVDKYQKLQNNALCKILSAFKRSPIKAMKIEAAISSSMIKFQKLCKNYAFRLLTLNSAHPIRQRVSSSFPPHDNGLELDWEQYSDWNDQILNKKVPSQLFRLLHMIKDHIPSLNIEKSCEILSPWSEKLNSLVDIHISELSKEEETSKHQEKIKSLNNQTLIIYTDESKTDQSEYIGAGLAFKRKSDARFQTRF